MSSLVIDELFYDEKYYECIDYVSNNKAIPESIASWYKGACLTKLHKYEEGVFEFEKSWSLEPSKKSGISYVRSLASIGRVSEAEAVNKKIFALWPSLDLEACRHAFNLLKACNEREIYSVLHTAWNANASSPFLYMTIDFFERLLNDKTESKIPKEYYRDPVLGPYAEAFDFALYHMKSSSVCKGFAYAIEPLLHGINLSIKTGWFAEFGVFWGRSLNQISNRIKDTVYGFDSFRGLPEDWKENEKEGAYSTHGYIPKVNSNVKLFQGWFTDTIPKFVEEVDRNAGLVHIDCDLYSSTKDVLTNIHSKIQPGTIIVFDDYLAHSNYKEHEKKAFEEFAFNYNIEYEVVAIALMSREVAIRVSKV